MKRYIKANVAKADIKTIQKNLFIYSGVLESEVAKFFKEFDALLDEESESGRNLPEEEYQLYTKYLPLAKKCYEIATNIFKGMAGHTSDVILCKDMYETSMELLKSFPFDWKNSLYNAHLAS